MRSTSRVHESGRWLPELKEDDEELNTTSFSRNRVENFLSGIDGDSFALTGDQDGREQILLDVLPPTRCDSPEMPLSVRSKFPR